MPAQIKSGNNVKANYTYLSDGTKAAAYTSANAGRDYAGSFTYTRGSGGSKTLESIAFGGGRIRKTGTNTYDVDYYITDHLGSVRVIVNASGSVVEQNDYYPFGTRHPNGLPTLSANRWRFSGKEEQDAAFGIAYSDFGTRLYDRSAAWTAIDPLAEKYYSVSPYAYCHNDPINRIDGDGNIDLRLIKKGAIGLGAGVGSAIAGAAITGGTAGIASPAGAIMVVDGVVGILFGATYVLLGVLSSPSEENDRLMELGPTDVSNTLAKSGDIMMNNQNQEIEITTDILKLCAGAGIMKGENSSIIKSLSGPKKVFSNLGTLLQSADVLQKIIDIFPPKTKASELDKDKNEEEMME